MLSWFSRLGLKPSHPDRSDRQKRQEVHVVVPPSPLPVENSTSKEPVPVPTHPPLAASVVNRATVLTPEQPQKHTFTATFNTPHDDALAELQGRAPSPPAAATPSTSAGGMQSLDTLPAATPPEPHGSFTSSPLPPLTDPLYDPFTGVTMGVLSPTSSTAQSTEVLWTRLSRIRTLQAEVASMHVTMEGIGLAESSMPRLRRTAPRTVGERLEDDEDIDGDGDSEVEMWRAREFERSERRFDGRKERIEQIMSKVGTRTISSSLSPLLSLWDSGADDEWCRHIQLDDLSKELTEFHALDTPAVNFAATSRSMTEMSTPVQRNPMRPSHLHRISSEASVHGREESFDSPASLQVPLPSVAGPSGAGAAPSAQPDAEVP
jgi:hypothetical protein